MEVRHDPDGSSSSPISDDRDEYPKVTQADLDRASFRIGLQALIHDTLREFVLSTNLLNSSGRGAHGPSGRFPAYMAVVTGEHAPGRLK